MNQIAGETATLIAFGGMFALLIVGFACMYT